jgi:hypothetical protein
MTLHWHAYLVLFGAVLLALLLSPLFAGLGGPQAGSVI